MKVEAPQRAMVIMAHPDDPEFFSGGTIAQWCAAGTEMVYLILTNGNKGSDDPDMTPEKLAAIRKKEQQAAADLLGVKHIVYLEEPDGELRPTLDLRVRVVAEIRKHRPDAVITFDPTRYFYGTSHINHTDHRAAGEIAIDSIFPAARNRMYHPELLDQGLEPHTVEEVYLARSEQSELWIDITDLFDTKIKAILCHTSQIRDPENLVDRIKERTRAVDQFGREIFREEYRVMKIG